MSNCKYSNRDNNLDILRGIAIIFVIFGHVTRDADLQAYIWGFHMPIFFFISGVLYNPSKYDNTIDFLKSKFKSLMVPYIFFYLLTLGYWILIERHTRGSELTIGSQFIGLFYGTYSLDYMYFNGALWFLPCLFSMEIIYWFVEKTKRQWLILTIIVALNVVGLASIDILCDVPLGLNAAIIALLFYGIGHILKDIIRSIKKEHTGLLIGTTCMCIFLQYIIVPYTRKADLAALDISVPYLYIPTGLIGILLYLSLSKIIGKNALLEWLGRSSLVLFALQEPVYRAVIFIGTKITHIETNLFRQDLFCCSSATVVTILVITPMVFGYNKLINPFFKKI